MRQPKCRLCGHEHPLGAPHATGTARPERQERSRDHRPGKKAAVKTVTIGGPRIGKTAAVDRQVAKLVKAGVRVFRTKPPAKNTEAAVLSIAEALAVPAREPERLPFTDSDVNAQDPVECFLASPAGQTIPPEVRKIITDHLTERAERRKYMREYQRGRRKAKKRKAKR